MRGAAAVIVLASGLMMAACSTVPGDMPQRSDLFQISNDALLAYEAGEDAKAEQLYMGLARQLPHDYEIWFRLGNLYARSNKPDAAADAYQRALSINASDARAWYNLGIVRLRQGWASMVQAQSQADTKDPLYRQTDELLERLNALTSVAEGWKPPARKPVTK